MEEQINISQVLDVLKRRWWIFIVCGVLFMASGYVLTRALIKPMYSSSGTLYVSSQSEAAREQSNATIQASYLTASARLAATCAEILRARTFLTMVSNDVGGIYTPNQIKSMMSVSSLNETELLQINVVSTSPDDSFALCQSIVRNAPNELLRVIEGGSVKIVDDAVYSNAELSPMTTRNSGLGLLLGLVVAFAITFLLEMLDKRIRDPEKIAIEYGLPILAEIPMMNEK